MAEREVNIVGDCLRSNTLECSAGISFASPEWAAAVCAAPPAAPPPHPPPRPTHCEALRSRAASRRSAEWETSLGKIQHVPNRTLVHISNGHP
jgi:hypothetical protein